MKLFLVSVVIAFPLSFAFGQADGGACEGSQCADDAIYASLPDQAPQPSPTPTTADVYGKQIKPLLAIPIPLVSFSDITVKTAGGKKVISIPFLADYIIGIYRLAVAVGGVLAAVMIMVGGLQYLTARGDASRVNKAKERISNAIIGLLLIIGANLILVTVNPDLITLKALDFTIVDTQEFKLEVLSTADYQGITGRAPPSDPEIAAAQAAAIKVSGIDDCIMDAIVKKESAGRANVIGHDEDVARGNMVGSRGKFIKSGKKFSGETFTGTKELAFTGSFLNDDGIRDGRRRYSSPTPPNFGLDPRFTHGIGLGQITPLIRGTEMERCSSNNYIGRTIGSRCYTVPELLIPQTNLEAVAALAKIFLKSCGGNLGCLFTKYAGRGCSARNAQCGKLKQYAACSGKPELVTDEPADCGEWIKKGKAQGAAAKCGWQNKIGD